MSYSFKLIPKEEQKSSVWAGGSSTQLAIYPEDAEYSKVNFKWRLSSAKVEIAESTFTHLPKVDRYIMTLNGDLKLDHGEHGNVNLKPFQVHNFNGEWTTKSYGMVTDFNLMLRDGCKGNISPILMASNSNHVIEKNLSQIEAFYCVEGTVTILINNEDNISLNQNDLLLLYTDNEDIIVTLNSLEEDCKLVRAQIYQ